MQLLFQPANRIRRDQLKYLTSTMKHLQMRIVLIIIR